jgi:hypothetical protein
VVALKWKNTRSRVLRSRILSHLGRLAVKKNTTRTRIPGPGHTHRYNAIDPHARLPKLTTHIDLARENLQGHLPRSSNPSRLGHRTLPATRTDRWSRCGGRTCPRATASRRPRGSSSATTSTPGWPAPSRRRSASPRASCAPPTSTARTRAPSRRRFGHDDGNWYFLCVARWKDGNAGTRMSRAVQGGGTWHGSGKRVAIRRHGYRTTRNQRISDS